MSNSIQVTETIKTRSDPTHITSNMFIIQHFHTLKSLKQIFTSPDSLICKRSSGSHYIPSTVSVHHYIPSTASLHSYIPSGLLHFLNFSCYLPDMFMFWPITTGKSGPFNSSLSRSFFISAEVCYYISVLSIKNSFGPNQADNTSEGALIPCTVSLHPLKQGTMSQHPQKPL